MTSRNWLTGWDPRLLPRLDQLDVATPTPTLPDEGFAAEPPAPVTTAAGLPKRVPFATLDDDLDAPVPYVPVSMGVDEYECPEPGCDFHIYAVGPEAAPGYLDDLRMDIDEHRTSHATRGASSVAGLNALLHDPTISSGGAVTKPNPAPSDDSTPSLVQLDRDEAAARVLNAAMNWEATEHGTPWDHADAEQALRDAVRDYREPVAR